MKNKLRLRRALKNVLDTKENTINQIPGLLGTLRNGKKQVKVANRKGFVYVRLHGKLTETVQAYNDQVLQLYDMPILVKRVQGKGYHYYVTGKDTGRYENWGGNNAQAQYAQHGNQHSFGIGAGGSDVVWVFKRQFMPLMLYPYSGTAVRVAEDWYQWGDTYKHFTGSIVELGSAKPPIIGDSRFVTLYVEGSTNTVKGITGSVFPSVPFPSDVTPYINIPTPNQGIPLSAVLLTFDTVNIAWNNIYDDIRPIYGVGGDSAFSTGTIPIVGQSLYLTNDYVISPITGSYNYALMATDSNPRYEIRKTFTTSGTIIATFIDEYHNVGYINSGQWTANLLLNAPTTSGKPGPFVYVEMWKRKADGTETLISVTPHNAWGVFYGENRYSFVGSIADGVIIEADSKLFIRVRAFHNGSVGESSWLGIYVNREANSTINFPASPFYGGGHVIEWADTPVTQRGYINFIGAGVHAYDDGTDTVVSIPGTVTVQQNGVYKGSGTTLNFAAGCSVAFTGNVANINVTGTGMSIYDDSILKTTSLAMSFDAGLHVDATGSIAYIQSIDTTIADLQTYERFIIAAHRGDINPTDGFPENTLAGMISAAQRGAHLVELDVQRSSDGIWYGMHDTTIDRTTNGTGNISDKTSAQLDALWIDGGYGYVAARHSGTYHPPTLTSVMTALSPFNTILNLDVKESSVAAATNLANLLVKSGWQHRVVIGVATQAEAQAMKNVCPIIFINGNKAWAESDMSSGVTGTYTTAQILEAAPKQIHIYDDLANYGISNQAQLTHDTWNIGARGYGTWDLPLSMYEHHKFVILNEHINDPNGHSGSFGGGGSALTIYNNEIPKVTGTTGIDFGVGFSVLASGSVAYINTTIISGTSTYVRAGAPVAESGITGTCWRIPEGEYATGTLSLFVNGVAQTPGIHFTEQYSESGTFCFTDMPPTGSIFTAIWGVPSINLLAAPSPIGAVVKRTNSQTFSNAGTIALSWDTETLDQNNFFTTGSATRLTIQKTGWYIISGYVDWAANATGKRHAQWKVNNTTWLAADQSPPSSDNDCRLNPCQVAYLTAGDYLELYCYQNSGGNLNVDYAEANIVTIA